MRNGFTTSKAGIPGDTATPGVRIIAKSGLLESAILAFGAVLATPALSMDPACQSLMQSQRNMANTPVHITLTETRNWSKALSRAAAGMGVGGTKTSEEISTGKDVYVRHHGQWIDMQTRFAEMANPGDPDSDPEIGKAGEAKRCTALPDEIIAGQAATVYQTHTPEIDTKIWISKITHLPLKSEITNRAGGTAMSSITVSTYDYKNVQVPVGAISMKQMVAEPRKAR